MKTVILSFPASSPLNTILMVIVGLFLLAVVAGGIYFLRQQRKNKNNKE